MSEASGVETARQHPTLILTKANGFLNASLLMRLRAELLGELGNGAANWIGDFTAVTRCDDTVRDPLLDVLKTFRDRDGGKVILAVSSPNVRMVLSSIAMTSPLKGGPRITLVESVNAAYTALNAPEAP
jgi:anti-anti-sigma regulatory factor